MSRSVWLRQQSQRGEAANPSTIYPGRLRATPVVVDHPSSQPTGTFSELFQRFYPHIRRLLNAKTDPGLALFVVGEDELEAAAWWPADEELISPLIVGRHGAAEVFLPSDSRLSLRHLAIVIHPHQEGRVHFRVLDLRTPTAFVDDEGRQLEALEADGPMMVRCASFAALLFPTGESDEPWPEEAQAAWERVPERVHLERAHAEPEQWLEQARREFCSIEGRAHVVRDAPTLSTSFPGPTVATRDLVGPDPARGELVIRSRFGRVVLRAGETALRRGVLLGRYDRCDTVGVGVLDHGRLSRVHLLLIKMAGALYAVDTASRNGTWQGPKVTRVARVQVGRPLDLAHEATVSWHPFH